MKKKDHFFLNESCFMMNIPKSKIDYSKIKVENSFQVDEINASNISDESKYPVQQSINSHSILRNLNYKLKQENSQNDSDETSSSNRSSPPLTSLGPGAEIKGKLCHPIASSSKFEESEDVDETNSTPGISGPGGRLTFFREGTPLLELSHRKDQGSSWVQVKSKTYWPPPPTITTTTTIQHPLRHGTPNTHSDELSSLNSSSPRASDHVRKQTSPSKLDTNFLSSDYCFYMLGKQNKHLKRLKHSRRNPFIVNCNKTDKNQNTNNSYSRSRVKNSISFSEDVKVFEKKGFHLKNALKRLKIKFSYADDLTIQALFSEKHLNLEGDNELSNNTTFNTPRKRACQVRSFEGGADNKINSHYTRKKHHADAGTSSHNHSSKRTSSRRSSTSPSPSNRGMPIAAPSPYSIDSLLSDGDSSSRKTPVSSDASFLRTLLKPEVRQTSRKYGSKANAKVAANVAADAAAHAKVKAMAERGMSSGRGSPFGVNERPPSPADAARYDSALSFFLRPPYFDPHYMMLQSLGAAAPTFLPPAVAVSQTNNVASAMAAAAAAAASGYPLNPLQLSAISAAGLRPGFSPSTSFPTPLLRQSSMAAAAAAAVRSSPLPPAPPSHSPTLSSAPSLATSPCLVTAPLPAPSPYHPHQSDAWPMHMAVPRGSPFKAAPVHLPTTSPPPQDVPLNLTKPKKN